MAHFIAIDAWRRSNRIHSIYTYVLNYPAALISITSSSDVLLIGCPVPVSNLIASVAISHAMTDIVSGTDARPFSQLQRLD